MEERQRPIHYRKFFGADTKIHAAETKEESLRDISLFNLIAAYKSALDQMPRKVVHEIDLLNVSVDEQMSFVMDYLRVHGETTVLQLVSHMTDKVRIIVTVIALLELTKNSVIGFGRSGDGDDVAIIPLGSLQPVSGAST